MRRWIESAAILFLSTQFTTSVLATPFSALQSLNLLPRAETCGGKADLDQCGSNFPSEFCCPAQSTCIPLNTTVAVSVICCPKGADCNLIQPIPCDVSQYNATLHPDNQIHIDNTTSIKLPTCGDKCCPLGYNCNGNTCRADETAPSLTPSTSPVPSSSAGPSASQTSSSNPVTVVKNGDDFPAKAVVAGFFPGMILGALLTLLLIWVVKKRRESLKNRYSGDFGHVSRSISDPIYDPVHAARTDFIRRGSVSAQNSPMTQRQTSGAGTGGGFMSSPRVRSLFSKSPKIGTAMSMPMPAVRAGDRYPYRTPTGSPTRKKTKGKGKRPDVTRSGSTETIDVLMPAPSFLQVPLAPGMKENGSHRLTQDSTMTQATTFTKLMERAGYDNDKRSEVRTWKGGPFMRN